VIERGWNLKLVAPKQSPRGAGAALSREHQPVVELAQSKTEVLGSQRAVRQVPVDIMQAVVAGRPKGVRPDPPKLRDAIEHGVRTFADDGQLELDLDVILESHGTLRTIGPGGVSLRTPRSTRLRGA